MIRQTSWLRFKRVQSPTIIYSRTHLTSRFISGHFTLWQRSLRRFWLEIALDTRSTALLKTSFTWAWSNHHDRRERRKPLRENHQNRFRTIDRGKPPKTNAGFPGLIRSRALQECYCVVVASHYHKLFDTLDWNLALCELLSSCWFSTISCGMRSQTLKERSWRLMWTNAWWECGMGDMYGKQSSSLGRRWGFEFFEALAQVELLSLHRAQKLYSWFSIMANCVHQISFLNSPFTIPSKVCTLSTLQETPWPRLKGRPSTRKLYTNLWSAPTSNLLPFCHINLLKTNV